MSSGSNSPSRKRTRSDNGKWKELTVDVTAVVPDESVKVVEYPENSSTFWTGPETMVAGQSILVREYFDGLLSQIYIKRMIGATSCKFKFPSSLLPEARSRMKEIVDKTTLNESTRKLTMEGLDDRITYQHQLQSEEFWSRPEVVKIMRWNFIPYYSEHNLKIRMLQLLPEAFHKTLKDKRNGMDFVWRGSSTTVSFSNFKDLYNVLESFEKKMSYFNIDTSE